MTFTEVRTHPLTYRAYKYAGTMSLGCVHAGKVERTCVPRDKHFFNDFLSFLKFDMESRGIRLDKEDNMTIDGAILTADSHGDKFQCNRLPPKVRSL